MPGTAPGRSRDTLGPRQTFCHTHLSQRNSCKLWRQFLDSHTHLKNYSMLCAKADTLARGWHLRKACVVCNGKFILLGNFLIFFPSSSLSCLLIFFFNRFSFSIFLSTFLVSLCFFFTCLFFPPFSLLFFPPSPFQSFSLTLPFSFSPFIPAFPP